MLFNICRKNYCYICINILDVNVTLYLRTWLSSQEGLIKRKRGGRGGMYRKT